MSERTDVEAAGDGYGGVLILRNVSTGSLEYQRTPTVFKPITAAITPEYKGEWEATSHYFQAEWTIWTPATGKKFRVLGWSLWASEHMLLGIKDGGAATAGTTGIIIPVSKEGSPASTPPNFANGYLSSTAVNKLTLYCRSKTGTGAETCSEAEAKVVSEYKLYGYIFGTEE
jgi:hypothetical protein